MKRWKPIVATAAVFLLASVFLSACNLEPGVRKARLSLFIGVDASGSFQRSGHYDDSIIFLAHYIYGHMNEYGRLQKPRELFVASIGGNDPDEPKSFHPIHDFTGKTVGQIEEDLRAWFPPQDALTDFNPFFQEIARIAKERNLVLAPISVMVVTDGIPDISVARAKSGSGSAYEQIDFSPLEYLSRNLTVRLTYLTPKSGQSWRRSVRRQRVRLWTVDAGVMQGWREQLEPGTDLANQDKLWKWVYDNVDFRVRSIGF